MVQPEQIIDLGPDEDTLGGVENHNRELAKNLEGGEEQLANLQGALDSFEQMRMLWEKSGDEIFNIMASAISDGTDFEARMRGMWDVLKVANKAGIKLEKYTYEQLSEFLVKFQMRYMKQNGISTLQ